LPLAFEGKREEIVASRFVFGGGGEHAGSRKARACTGGRSLEYRDRKAAQCEPPGNRQPDDARSNNRHVHGGGEWDVG
jgi:hypothetical protein